MLGLAPMLTASGFGKEVPAATMAAAPFKAADISGFSGKWTGVVYLSNASTGGFEAYRIDSLTVRKSSGKKARITGAANLEILGAPTKKVKITGTLTAPKLQKIKADGHQGYIKRAKLALKFSNGTTGTGYFQVSEINGFKGSGASVTCKRKGGWKTATDTDARFSQL